MTTKTVRMFDVKNGEFVVAMPRGAHVLTAQMRDGLPCMWALVDMTEPAEKRRFVFVGSCDPILNAEWLRYVGTVQVRDGECALHLFERVKGG